MGKITTFTTEEIRELEMRPSDVIREKIEAAGGKGAAEAFDEFVGMFNGVHDGYLLQANAAEIALYKEVGPDKYLEYMYDYFYNANTAFLKEGYWDLPFKERARFAINAPRCFHNCNMKLLSEDDEKISFVMDPCGAGQKLWDMGLCGVDCGVCDKAHPITAGGKNFPVYCTHAPIGEICCNDFGEPPIYQQDYPEQTGPCSCVFNVYKNKEAIPESYYTRIGKKRP